MKIVIIRACFFQLFSPIVTYPSEISMEIVNADIYQIYDMLRKLYPFYQIFLSVLPEIKENYCFYNLRSAE